MKILRWLGLAVVAAIVAAHYFGARVAAMPQGVLPVPASQSAAIASERWLEDSPGHIILSYDLRSPSASLGLAPQTARDMMARAICSSPQTQGRQVGVVVNEPDGSTFVSFETNCQ